MDTCQIIIGADMTFYQILDGILTEGPSPSLGKLKGTPVIKSKPYGSKNKKLKPHGWIRYLTLIFI
jgi:hypothetical protein